MKKILILALLVSGITLAGFMGSQKMCHVSGGRSALDSLKLSDLQKTQIKEIEAEYNPKENAICMEICGKRAELMRALGTKGAMDAEITGLIDSIAALDAKLEKEIAAHVLEIKGRLDARQSELYLQELRSEMRCPINMKS